MITLAIIGRPNVGKSTLFNRLCKKRVSITAEQEGVTRDRIYGTGCFFEKPFRLIDTGGIDPLSRKPLIEEITRQAEYAIEESDALIFVVDKTVGVTEVDRLLLRWLQKKIEKPLVIAVNKCDGLEQLGDIYNHFFSLGSSLLFPLSALHGFHIESMLEKLFALTPPQNNAPLSDSLKKETISVTIVGRPNVGKSTLFNSLLQEERSIASNIPGTTRDHIESLFIREGKRFSFSDTAGIQRKQSEKEVVDKFARIRTREAIERASICLFMIDAREGITTEEKHLIRSIEKGRKACLWIINKWDLVKNIRMEHYENSLQKVVPFFSRCPHLFISAKSGRNVNKIFPMICQLYKNNMQRITTSELNRFFSQAMHQNPPALSGNKALKIYYVTQIESLPPRFTLFVNYPSLLTKEYQKYLINQLKKKYDFQGVPLFLKIKGKHSSQ